MSCFLSLCLLLAGPISVARSNLLLSKHYFDVTSDCSGPFDLLQVKAAGEECIPSKCSADSQFGGKKQTDCADKFDLEEQHVVQEFHDASTNCTQEPFFVLVHGTTSCRNIFGEEHVFECVGSGRPSATRFKNAQGCAQYVLHAEHQHEDDDSEGSTAVQLKVAQCLDTGLPWQTRVLGCSRQTYMSADTQEGRVVALSAIRPRLNHLLSGSLWEEDEGHAGSAAAVSAMTWPVQLLLGVVSFLLTLAALD